MHQLIVLAVLVASAAAFSNKDKCPMLLGKYPFDEQRIVGDWSLVAGLNVLGNEQHRCTKFNVNLLDQAGAHVINYSGVNKDGKAVKGEMYGQPIGGKDYKSATVLAAWRKEDGTFSTVYKQAIVATDYENYAVFIACKPKFDEATKQFTRHIRAGIISRKQTLSNETLEVLKNVLSSYDIDPATLQMTDHSSC